MSNPLLRSASAFSRGDYASDPKSVTVTVVNNELTLTSTDNAALIEVAIPRPDGCPDAMESYSAKIPAEVLTGQLPAGDSTWHVPEHYRNLAQPIKGYDRLVTAFNRMKLLRAVRAVLKRFPSKKMQGDYCRFAIGRDDASGRIRIYRDKFSFVTDLEAPETMPPVHLNLIKLRKALNAMAGKTVVAAYSFKTGRAVDTPFVLTSGKTASGLPVRYRAMLQPVD